MQAKKKAEKRAAVAASATGKKRTRDDANGGTSKKKKRSQFGERSAPTFTRADAISGASATDNRAELMKALGENIDTRLKEITFEDEIDQELNPDVFNERKMELMEEARLAAGTAQRAVAARAAQFLSQSQAQKEGVHQTRIHHNSNSITAVASLGSEVVVFGDKTGKVYWVDISPDKEARGMTSGERLERMRRKKIMLEPSLGGSIVSVAVSDTRHNRPTARDLFEKSSVDMSCTSYIAAGAADGSIGIWETKSKQHKGLLYMHRKPVTGLAFRLHTSILHSVSEDGVLRVWSVPQMMSMDSLFGHIGKVFSIDSLRKETCVSVGEDGTMRFWKVDSATQQAFSYLIQHRNESLGIPTNHAAIGAEKKNNNCPISIESVAMVNEGVMVAGAVDGTLLVFDLNKRKPVIVIYAAHGYGFVGDGTGLEKEAAIMDREEDKEGEGETQRKQNPNPITAVAAVAYGDLIASASYDGFVRLWQLSNAGTSEVALRRVAELPVAAIVTALRFSPDGDHLYIACSKEPRFGRWVVQRSALNSVLVVPLTSLGLQSLKALPGAIEHVPALLYGFQDSEDEEDENNDETENHEAVDNDSDRDEDLENFDEEVVSKEEESGSSFFKVGEDGQLIMGSLAPLQKKIAKRLENSDEDEDVMKKSLKKKDSKKKKLIKTAKQSVMIKSKKKSSRPSAASAAPQSMKKLAKSKKTGKKGKK